ncbi:thioredoxin family protein [Pararcticibacter amylolyticus]|uniref:Thioredoxin family protein n=1 Tax=Pararcticibacter amylolyticus TaxID=2173175 RepID=A0A2U2PJB1_9SPHI|nr:thioredoxin family protein [Pararcticibacter amylolyticus]PWG81498.1 thioredoxin family protein [Pararcticibacter amylolyticus]
MDLKAYLDYFQQVLADEDPKAPYDSVDYMEYTKLNWVRMNRWFKTAELSAPIITAAGNIIEPQKWIVITEPWCGDAAHIVPFIQKVAELNPLVSIDYELRDSEPFSISSYLTNGSKSIPKLIIRDESGKDLGVWGPRPAPCQELYRKLTAEKADFETLKVELQKWYNKDQGREIQKELTALIQGAEDAVQE